jgi:hypothetical protein
MGIIVMLGVSVAAYRRARATGRNPLFWVTLVWLVGIAAGIAAAIPGAIIDVLTARSIEEVTPFIALWGMAIGNTLGSIAVAVRAGQKPISH